MRLKIAARKSDLARLQAYRVGEALKALNQNIEVKYQFSSSLGDQNQSDPLWKMPEKGVFTEDFLNGLINEECDMVVHSWKDLPTEERKHTELVATLPRADQRDLILFSKSSLDKAHWEILSSSPRREHNLSPFIKSFVPQAPKSFEFKTVRGNIPTRLTKLMQGEGDALVVAKAALDRLLLAQEDEFSEAQAVIKQALRECRWIVAPLSLNPTAAAQGAIVVEIKKDKPELKALLSQVNVEADFKAVTQERKLLSSYGGGCHLKLGISVAQKDAYQFLFTRGMTPEGEEFDRCESLHSKTPLENSPGEDFWPKPDGNSRLFRREAIKVPDESLDEADGLVVSRIGPGFEELIPKLKGKYLWAAGTKTWEKLVQLGLWVHGSFDSLGEETLGLDHLAQSPIRWKKLTHTNAEVGPTESLAYYRLVPNDANVKTELKDIKHFFWMSYSSFEYAAAQLPEIKKASHSSGPGNTAELLKKELGEEAVRVYLSYEEWLKKHLKETP